MAATTKLIVYNEALRELGSHPLANTTTVNTRLTELNGAFDHAVEYMLTRADWNFARRRATLTGTADTSFSPFTYRYARPSDYLRKRWIKLAADDEFQVEHAEIAAVIYANEATALMEYVSDHADNYEAANWPPHFTRCMSIYLAILTGGKLARADSDLIGSLYSKLDIALADAEKQEDVFTINGAIATDRLPTMRRCLEMMGQAYAGAIDISSHADMLRWQMNKSWDLSFKYCLERGAWNFATKRALFTLGAEAADIMPGAEHGGIIEGFVVDGAEGDAETAFNNYDFAGFNYGWYLPDDFLMKIWFKAYADADLEIEHQIVRDAIFANREPCTMEYIANDAWTSDPDNWPAHFVDVMAARLAMSVAPELVVVDGPRGRKIEADRMRPKLEAKFKECLARAKNFDAIQQAPKRQVPGRFLRARMGGSVGLRRLN